VRFVYHGVSNEKEWKDEVAEDGGCLKEIDVNGLKSCQPRPGSAARKPFNERCPEEEEVGDDEDLVENEPEWNLEEHDADDDNPIHKGGNWLVYKVVEHHPCLWVEVGQLVLVDWHVVVVQPGGVGQEGEQWDLGQDELVGIEVLQSLPGEHVVIPEKPIRLLVSSVDGSRHFVVIHVRVDRILAQV